MADDTTPDLPPVDPSAAPAAPATPPALNVPVPSGLAPVVNTATSIAAAAHATDSNAASVDDGMAPYRNDTVDGAVDGALADVGKFVTSPSEIAKAVVKGGRDLAQETYNSLHSGIVALGKAQAVNEQMAPLTPDQDAAIDNATPRYELPDNIKPSTTTGSFVASAEQFLVPFGVIGKAGKAIGLAGKLPGMVETGLKTGATMAAFFDPYADRLSNLVQSHPSLANPVTAFLQADPNDSEAVARLKNGLENAGVGAALDGLAHGISAIKSYQAGDIPAALDSAEAAGQAHEASKVLEATPVAPEGEATPAAPEATATNPDETGQGATPLNSDASAPAPAAPKRFSDDQVSSMADGLVAGAKADALDPYSIVPTNPNRLAYSNGGEASLSPINVNHVDATDEEKRLLTVVGQKIGQDIDRQPVTFDSITKAAEVQAVATGADPQALAGQLIAAAGDLRGAAVTATQGAMHINFVNQELNRVISMSAEGMTGEFGSIEARDAYLHRILSQHLEVGAGRMDLGSAGGEFLNSLKNNPQGSQNFQDALEAYAKQVSSTPKAALELLTERLRFGDGSLDTNTQIMKPLRTKIGDTLASFYVNSLLGFPTLIKKGVADLWKGGMIQPMEQAYRGIYRGATSGDWTQMTQAGGQYVGMVKSLFDTIQFGGRSVWANAQEAFQTGKQVLDASQGSTLAEGGSHANPLEELAGGFQDQLASGNYVNAAVSGVGNVVGLPGRLINSLHELSQQVIYRGRVYGKAATDYALQADAAAKTGEAMPMTKDQYVQNALKNSFGEDGAAVDKEALGYAQDGTYSRPLSSDGTSAFESTASKLQDVGLQHPGMRLIMPFVRAPVRLAQDVFQYTPVIQTAKDAFKGEFAAGGQRAEAAYARLATGSTIWAGAAALAYNGMITPSDPVDADAAKQLNATGWREHSLVLTDPDGTQHYYGLDAIEPIGSILALAADASTILPHLSGSESGSVATQMMLAITHDTLSKAYLQNFSNLLSAVGRSTSEDSADQKYDKLIRSMVGGFVPSMLARDNDDPLMREVRGVVDALKARIPGLSNTLDPQRDVTGRVVEKTPGLGPSMVSPFFHSTRTGTNELAEAMADIATANPTGFKDAPPIMRLNANDKGPGVDLREYKMPDGYTAYDNYRRLSGSPKEGAPTMSDKLLDLVRSPDFQKQPMGNAQIHGPQFDAVNSVIGQYRQAGKEALMQLKPVGESRTVGQILADTAKANAQQYAGQPQPQGVTVTPGQPAQ